MLVYLITNLVNNKVYVGKLAHRKNLIAYWEANMNRALKGSKTKPYLYAAIRKHGVNNFKVEEIEKSLTPQELCEAEVKWIAHYDSNNPIKGYNLTKGGEGNVGHTVSADARKRIGDARRGKPLSEEHKQKLREAKLLNPVRYWQGKRRGDILSEEGRASISKQSTGRKMSLESLIKRVAGWKETMKKKGYQIQEGGSKQV